MTRTGQAAIDYARSRVGGTMPASGYCLQFVRQCFDIPSYYASAIDAWNGSTTQHPGDRNPPPAVPLFFASPSVYDHVVFGVSASECISTFNADIRSFAGIADIERQFSASYLGWTEDLNTVRVYSQGDDGEDDFMSYLSYEEQRRLLQAADSWLGNEPNLMGNTNRLPHIHAQVDNTLAMSTNNNNGIWQIINTLGSLTAPTGRAIAIVFLVVLVAATAGVLVAINLSAAAGGVAGVAVLAGGLLGWLGAATGKRDQPDPPTV